MPETVLGVAFPGDPPAGRYPFAAGTTLATSGGLTLPAGFLDARVYAVGSAARVGLRAIAVDAAAVTLTIGDVDTAALASTTFARDQTIPRRLALADPAGRLCGLLVVDPVALAALAGWPLGTHAIAVGAAELCASCVVPRPEQGLRSVGVPGQGPLAGDVWLLGAGGVILTVSGQTIAVNIVGDPNYTQRECGGSPDWVAPNPLRSINGVGPGPGGGFVFVPVPAPGKDGTALRIDPIAPATVRFLLAGPGA